MPEAAQDYVDVSGIEKGAEKMPAMDSPAPSMPSQPPPTKQPDQSELEYQKALHSYWTQAAEITNKRLEAARAAEKAQEDYQKAEAERRPALQQALQQEQAAINQHLPQMPQIPAPSMASPISKDTAMTMASIGMLIAGLGGFGSKSTGRAMMGAATGMLDGFYKGRYDQAAAAHRQWEDFFNYQMGLYKMQIDQFNARMAQSHLSLENKVEQYKLDMAPFQDAQERAAMAEKTYGDIFKDQAQLIGVMSKMNEANDKIKAEMELLPLKRQYLEAQIAGQRARTESLKTKKVEQSKLQQSISNLQRDIADMEKKENRPTAMGAAFGSEYATQWQKTLDGKKALLEKLEGQLRANQLGQVVLQADLPPNVDIQVVPGE